METMEKKSQFTVDSTVITWSTQHTHVINIHWAWISFNCFRYQFHVVTCLISMLIIIYLCLDEFFFVILVRVPLSRMAIKFVIRICLMRNSGLNIFKATTKKRLLILRAYLREWFACKHGKAYVIQSARKKNPRKNSKFFFIIGFWPIHGKVKIIYNKQEFIVRTA